MKKIHCIFVFKKYDRKNSGIRPYARKQHLFWNFCNNNNKKKINVNLYFSFSFFVFFFSHFFFGQGWQYVLNGLGFQSRMAGSQIYFWFGLLVLTGWRLKFPRHTGQAWSLARLLMARVNSGTQCRGKKDDE